MVDFHCHVLPGLDDGCENMEESLALLQMLREQKIGTVVATPHFYPAEQSPAVFLEKREEAFYRLSDFLNEDLPKIRLGAEIAYYDGISRMEELEAFCIEGTNVLFLEMPFFEWSEYMVNEILSIPRIYGFTIVLAHIERYIRLKKNAALLEKMLENGILTQSNLSFFTDFFTKRRACKMLENRQIYILGSDSHNISSRAPHWNEALLNIQHILGEEALRRLDRHEKRILFSD